MIIRKLYWGKKRINVEEFIKLNKEKVKRVPYCKNGNTDLSRICQKCKEYLPVMAEYDNDIRKKLGL